MSAKKLCIHAMGIALFVVLTLCLQVPVFQNYYLCLGYFVMAFYIYFFGTAGGTLVGTLGVVLYCCLTGGLRGMPGWTLGNLLMGLICGTAACFARRQKRMRTRQAIMAAAVLLSTALGILVVKSLTEAVFYSLPFLLRVATNSYAFAADAAVLALGFGLCIQGEAFFRNVLTRLHADVL